MKVRELSKELIQKYGEEKLYKELLQLYNELSKIDLKLEEIQPFISMEEIEKFGTGIEIFKDEVEIIRGFLQYFYDSLDCANFQKALKEERHAICSKLFDVIMELQYFDSADYPEELKK